MHWASKFEQFARIKRWYDSKDVAANAEQWMVEECDFLRFVLFTPVFVLARPLKRAAFSACETQTSDQPFVKPTRILFTFFLPRAFLTAVLRRPEIQ